MPGELFFRPFGVLPDAICNALCTVGKNQPVDNTSTVDG